MCSFSEQGTFIFAGSNDCCVYVWHWDLDVEHSRRCGDESSALITGDMNLSNGSSPPAEEEESMRYAYLLPFYPASYCAKGISVTCQPFAFCLSSSNTGAPCLIRRMRKMLPGGFQGSRVTSWSLTAVLLGTITSLHAMRRRAAIPVQIGRTPSEVCRLQGHRHDVLLLQVSHDSSGIATGSKDGCVRVTAPFSSPLKLPSSLSLCS